MKKIINGFSIAKEILFNIKCKIIFLKKNKINPYLVTLLIGMNTSSTIYVKSKIKIAISIGIKTKLFVISENINNVKIVSLIKKINKKNIYTGILIQFPLPTHIDKSTIFSLIHYKKDVDGFTYYNMGLLIHNNNNILPCTAQGIIYLLTKYFGNYIQSKKIIIIGRSLIVGKPLLLGLINLNCTVTLIHSFTNYFLKEINISDIIISSVGISNLIKNKYIKKGSFIIDVGINKINNKIMGDIQYNILRKISYVTPVPGGIGPTTVASLMLNIVKLCYFQNNINFI